MPDNAASRHKTPANRTTHRFITRDGRINVKRHGIAYRHPHDWYHWLLTLRGIHLFLLIGVVFLALNTVFALVYRLDLDGIANARPGNFGDAFFFSVQTLATIGYGVMAPQSLFANCVVVLESLTGLCSIAIMTGLLFGRFLRPTARLMFSHYAVLGPHEGIPTLMFRVANRRGNQILHAEIRVTLARNEKTLEGESIRRIYDLKLLRDYSPFFNLTWTVRHKIDADSPLAGATSETLCDSETEIIVLLTGIDDVFGQTVHARFAYNHEEILFGHAFVSMFRRDENNRPMIDYRHFDEVEPLLTQEERAK